MKAQLRSQTVKPKTPKNQIGWWPRQSLAVQLFIATTSITIVVMSVIIAITAWQSRTDAVNNIQRELTAALHHTDETLQMVFRSASARGQAILPVLKRELGGIPKPDGNTIRMQEGEPAPQLVVGDAIVNEDNALLERINKNTGADPAILVRSGDHWIRAATLLKDDKGNFRNGSQLAPNDVLSRALNAGEPYSGLLQRNGRWYAISVEPLKGADGKVYGGLTARVDVHNEIEELFLWVNDAIVAEHGALGILQRSADNQTWVQVAGKQIEAGKSLQETMNAGDVEKIESLFKKSNGFSSIDLGVPPETQFLAWYSVPNWNWHLYAMGSQEKFLANSKKQLYLQGFLLLIGTLLISLLVGWLTSLTLRPVRQVIEGMTHLGQGDLTIDIAPVPEHTRSEVHALLDNLRLTRNNLENTIAAVRASVIEINVGASEIAAGNTDLSSRTEQQAAALQETAASMEELAVTVKQNTDHAQHANELAMNASSAAGKGEQVVAKVVLSMEQISNSSGKIGEIVGVIEGIAFQTNILALNAAVEAARAGEQGRGFAVVAAEVRSLAQRSGESAKEIKSLIETSLNQISTGSKEVAEAGTAMQDLLVSVQHVTALMKEIAGASQEQSSGIEQVNQAVGQMDRVTQQNAALVEQAAAAAASLQAQAHHLAEAISVFKINAIEP